MWSRDKHSTTTSLIKVPPLKGCVSNTISSKDDNYRSYLSNKQVESET